MPSLRKLWLIPADTSTQTPHVALHTTYRLHMVFITRNLTDPRLRHLFSAIPASLAAERNTLSL